MDKGNLFVSSFFFIFSIIMCYIAYKLGLGTPGSPEAGFVGFFIAFVLGLISAYLIGASAINLYVKKKESEPLNFALWQRPIILVASLFLYAVFFNHLGYPLATFFLLSFLLWFFGKERPAKFLLLSAMISFGSYYFFAFGLSLPLPAGFLFAIIRGS